MSIDKRFRGDLEGTSKREMLTAMTGVEGSAGYVAIERVSATLQVRRGSFVLQHSGMMSRGMPQLTITVSSIRSPAPLESSWTSEKRVVERAPGALHPRLFAHARLLRAGADHSFHR